MSRHPVIARLAEIRQEQGISQEVLAWKLKTTQSALSRKEWGHQDVTLWTLARWADALGFEVVIRPKSDGDGAQ